MSANKLLNIIAGAILISFSPTVTAFAPVNYNLHQKPVAVSSKSSSSCTQLNAYAQPSTNRLLDDFRTADGEVVNPYRVLKVGRKAERKEIRRSYRKLCKKYHPDGVRFSEILPGRCNDLDDVRDEWERIKLSYEILSDKRQRQKYDRHSAISDPAAAIGRMALGTVGWGLKSLVKGAFDLAMSSSSGITEGDTGMEDAEVEMASKSKTTATPGLVVAR